MSKNQEKKEPKRSIPSWVSIPVVGGVVMGSIFGLSEINSKESPPISPKHINSYNPNEFENIGQEKQTTAGKDTILEGQNITFQNVIVSFDDDKGGHVRYSAYVEKGGDGKPSNDVRFKDKPDDSVVVISRPLVNPKKGNDPNGEWVLGFADGVEGYINDDAARKVGALKTEKHYSEDDGMNNMQTGLVKEVHEGGLLVQPYNADGLPVGEPVEVGVMRFGKRGM